VIIGVGLALLVGWLALVVTLLVPHWRAW